MESCARAPLPKIRKTSAQRGIEASHRGEHEQRADQDMQAVLERLEFAQPPGCGIAAINLLKCERPGNIRLPRAEPKIFRGQKDSGHNSENNNTFHNQSILWPLSACDE